MNLRRAYGLTEAVLTVPDKDAPKLKKLIGAAIKAGHLPATAKQWAEPGSSVPSEPKEKPKAKKEPKAKAGAKQTKAKEPEVPAKPETPWDSLAGDLPAPKSAVTDLGDFDGSDERDYVSPLAHIIGKDKPSTLKTWATDPNKMPVPGDSAPLSPRSMPNPTLHPKNVSAAERERSQSAWDAMGPRSRPSGLSKVPRPIGNTKPGGLARLFGKGSK
jgi:hypothetical protein